MVNYFLCFFYPAWLRVYISVNPVLDRYLPKDWFKSGTLGKDPPEDWLDAFWSFMEEAKWPQIPEPFNTARYARVIQFKLKAQISSFAVEGFGWLQKRR